MNKGIRQFLIVFGEPFWRAFLWIVPKRKDFITVTSFPDFEDTVRSLVNVLGDTDKKLIVLATKRKFQKPEWLKCANIVVFHKLSVLGLWFYARSKYVFFTHGMLSIWKPSSKQIVVNVWHGMPIKNIGFLDGKKRQDVSQCTLSIAYDQRFKPIIAKAFDIPENQVLISAHPRLDGMAIQADLKPLHLPEHKKLTMWLPTYRQSYIGDIRSDGCSKGDLFGSSSDLSKIDEIFRKHDCVCLIKPHPMAKANKEDFERYKNIIFIDEKIMQSAGVTLYQLLGKTDFLITDVSSVYFDYKFSGKPVVIYCPDFTEYKNSRGFVAPIETLVEEEIVQAETQLVNRLKELFSHGDTSVSKATFTGGVTQALLMQVGVI